MAERKMHADELEIDVRLVRRLVGGQFPHWAGLPLERVVSAGTDNAIYRLGDTMAVRLPRRPIDAERLEKELRWLPRLAPLLPLTVPVPLAGGAPAEGYPLAWAVYRWLQGEPANIAPLEDPARAALDLAAFLAALQGVDPTDGPPPGSHNAFRGEPLALRDEATRAAIDTLGDTIDAGEAAAAWEEALGVPGWDSRPVWIHGDLDSRNLLVEAGRIGAVIDFGCLGVGDPACDAMVAWKVLPPDARRIFREALSIDEATWARGRGWALSQAVVALAYYTLETNPVLVREARRWLAEVLSSISRERQRT